MILVDTSVWVEHLRAGDARLTRLLEDGEVLAHSFVIGELLLGNLQPRNVLIGDLRDLPQVRVASDDEVHHFIERRALFGRGIGYVDAHLLAAVQLMTGTKLWTRDRRLQRVAAELGLAAELPH